MELMFQRETYIKGTRCTNTESSDKNYLELDTLIQKFIMDFRENNSHKQIFILVGDSGTGKSSFLLNLRLELTKKE